MAFGVGLQAPRRSHPRRPRRRLTSAATAGQVHAGLAVAALMAVITARLGLSFGEWLRRVRR